MAKPNLQFNVEIPADDPLWALFLAALTARGFRHVALAQPVTLRLTADVYTGDPVGAWTAAEVAEAWPTAQVRRAARVKSDPPV